MNNKAEIVISAKDETARAFSSIKSELGSLAKSMSGLDLIGGIGVTATVAGLATLAKSSIDYMASLHDMAIATGASVESLSAMKTAATLSSTSLDEVQGSIKKLGISLGEAQLKGGDKARLFEQLGIDPKATRDTGQALFDLAKKLDVMPDKFKAMSVAKDLLGKQVSMPFLAELAQMDKLVAKVTTEQAAAADKFEDNMIRFRAGAAQMGTAIAVSVLPGMNEILEFSLQVKKEWGSLAGIIVGLGGGTVLKGLGLELDPLKRAAQESTVAINELIKARARLADTISTRDAVADRLGPLGKWIRDKQVDSATAAAKDAKARSRAALADEARLFKEQTDKEYADYLRKKAGKDLSNATVGGKATKAAGPIDVFGSGSYITKDKATAESIRASFEFENWAQGELAKANAVLEERARAMDDMHMARMETYRIETEGEEAVREAMEKTNTAVKEADNVARDLGLTFASAFEDAVIGGKKFSDVLLGLSKDIERIILRKTVTEPLAKAVEGVINDGGGTLFGGLKSLLGFATGGSFTVGGSGGTDSQLVAFKATPGELVSIATPAQNSGGGITIQQHIYPSPGISSADLMQAMVRAKDAAVAEIRSSQRRGGVFA